MLHRLTHHPAIRFLLSGGFNTAVTYALYLALLDVLPYRASYTIAFVSGIVLAYVLNRTFVFRSHRGLQSVLWMPLMYLLQYLAGLFIVWIWVEKLGWQAGLAPLAAILITLPLNFAISRLAFVKRPAKTNLDD
ncbi:GtrA family protein [Pseudomonas wadenswilerensis]